MSDFRPLVAITMGDPVGIGAEIVIKALNSKDIFECSRPFVIGDFGIMTRLCSEFGIKAETVKISCPENADYRAGIINILGVSEADSGNTRWGMPDASTGTSMVSYILKAVEMLLNGKAHAMATAPISKYAMQLAGFEYPGHTELIAEKTGCTNFAMMLAGDRIRTVLATIHVPLSQVSSILTETEILRIIRLTDESLKIRFGIKNPKIAVAGLNPHSGENGMFGNEESLVIVPAIKKAVAEGIDASGPHPPDTVFYHANKGGFDAVVCMYHDQGLIPFKLVHFDDGVNTTLGLPVIRTSVDHGTAYDIAGKGMANPASMIAAIRMAAAHAVNVAAAALH